MSEDPKSGQPPQGGEPSSSDTSKYETDPYGFYEDPYHHPETPAAPVDAKPPLPTPPAPVVKPPTAVAPPPKQPPKPPPPPPKVEPDEDDEDDNGMLRMSFMEHLEELRTRIIRALYGLGIGFVLCVLFANDLWKIASKPALVALKNLGWPQQLVQISPMDTFSIVWVKLPIVVSLFIASPWVLYQVWAFISPGLYKRERRWAAPFVICTAGLFVLGGCFAYFVAFRYGLEFLLGIGRDINITPMVSINEYFDLFVDVMLGIGLVFELPILIFFLTLLRIVTPKFLIEHSRYAILAIVIIAAIVTPTPDVFNLMLFAIPMVALYFVGVFAGWILILHREGRKFPWGAVLGIVFAVLLVIAGATWLAMWKFGFKLVSHPPFLIK
jgi:sec-independent protein translocase protein TatC